MNLQAQKAALLAAGDVAGLMALNKSLYGGFEMMARGYNGMADALVTSDGVNPNDVWAEAQSVVAERNNQRDRWVNLLTFGTSNVSENVWQFGDNNDAVMEKASEYGVPVAIRPEETGTAFGTPGDWYDVSARLTFRAIAEMSSNQLAAITNMALEADNKLIYRLVMERVFNPANVTFAEKGGSFTGYGFYNADGVVPPTYNANSFNGTHTHYRTSGAASVQSGDLDEIVTDFKSHGFGPENGNTLLLFVNPVEAQAIRGFRHASGAAEDFVPSNGSRFFTSDKLYGTQPSATWGPFSVIGAYNELLIIEDTRIAVGYMVALVSGGANVPTNPVALRQHKNMPGLRIFEGNRQDYPLVDSYFARFAGASIRQRGAGLVMQITTNASYAAPSALAI